MTDDRISEIASPFLEWTEQGYAIIDKVGFARALLAAGASEGQAKKYHDQEPDWENPAPMYFKEPKQ